MSATLGLRGLRRIFLSRSSGNPLIAPFSELSSCDRSSARFFHASTMAPIKVGDSLPSVDLFEGAPDKKVNLKDLCANGKFVIFGVPGAFTPGCSKTHLPGYVSKAEELKKSGIKDIICVSVNDPFVMAAWGENQNASGKVRMLADTNGALTKALDLELDLSAVLGSVRSKRYSLVVVDGKVTEANIEPDGKGLTCSLADRIKMVLIGAAILPHASMILDPTLEDVPAGVDELHVAAKFVGDHVCEHEPDIVVLATPHGLNLSDSIGIYANRIAVGDAEWNGQWGDFKVSANIHDDFAIEMYNHLQKKRVNSNLILPFGDRPAPLGWSEVVPLFFLSEQRGTTGTRRRVCPYDVVIIASPIQEKKHWDGDLADLTGQCVKVGHEMFELFERTEHRIFFLASANLSPCHKTLEENPLYLPEPGTAEVPVSRKALIFDETIEQWIRSGSRTILLERALGLALETFPCSMAVFGILQGILDRTSFGGDILARRVPTYFGMIVALFHANEKGWKVLPRPLGKAGGGQPMRP